MRLRPVILFAAATLVGCTQNVQPTPTTDDDKALYALGAISAKQIAIESFDLSDEELAMVKAGFTDAAMDKSQLDDDALRGYFPKLGELQSKRIEGIVKRDKEAGSQFLAKAASEAGAQALPSGLVFKSVQEGSGATPKSTDTVKVNYEGRFIDGKVFDSSEKHGAPAEFPLDGVIPCWTEGVQLMKVGGKAQMTCPSDLAYGDAGKPEGGIRGGTTLVFDVELLDIIKPEGDAAAAPAK